MVVDLESRVCEKGDLGVPIGAAFDLREHLDQVIRVLVVDVAARGLHRIGASVRIAHDEAGPHDVRKVRVVSAKREKHQVHVRVERVNLGREPAVAHD